MKNLLIFGALIVIWFWIQPWVNEKKNNDSKKENNKNGAKAPE
jgi:hypothetical protein